MVEHLACMHVSTYIHMHAKCSLEIKSETGQTLVYTQINNDLWYVCAGITESIPINLMYSMVFIIFNNKLFSLLYIHTCKDVLHCFSIVKSASILLL